MRRQFYTFWHPGGGIYFEIEFDNYYRLIATESDVRVGRGLYEPVVIQMFKFSMVPIIEGACHTQQNNV